MDGIKGDGIKPLFSTSEILKNKEISKEKFNQGIITEDISHEFFLSDGYKEFKQQLTKLEKDKHYSFVSFGQWSLKHVVFHLLKLAGPSDIYSTTYGLGPSSARGIVTGLNKGLIKSFNFLYDNKIKTYKVEAHDICSANFPIKVVNIHAKVTVLLNKNWGIKITGSAN